MYRGAKFPLSGIISLALALASVGRAQQIVPEHAYLDPFDSTPISPTADVPDTNAPASSAPDTNAPANNPPETNAPDTNAPSSTTLEVNTPPAKSNPSAPPVNSGAYLLHQALELVQLQQLDAALDKANAAIQATPKNADAYGLRAFIYLKKKILESAEKDFQTQLQLNDKDIQVKFNLAEIQFMQKKYDEARTGFVTIQDDPNKGDLATYKVFLCDLFGGHEDVASKELDIFNQVGSNPSYYFGNAAWSLYHHNTEDARDWLLSATNIYAPDKCRLYAYSLVNLGYLPLPPIPAH